MIPLLHDFAGETVLVFGAGSVGARKARRFAREARVVVIGPAFGDRAFGGAERVRAEPGPETAAAVVENAEPALVVAATDDDAVNAAVAEAAREVGALANRADVSGGRDAGEVVVPASVRDDPVTLAVATDGTSPAVSRYLRERFEEEFAGAGELAEITADLRERLKADGVAPDRRRAAVRTVVRSSEVWTALRTEDANPRQTARDVAADVLDSGTGDH